MNLVKPPGKSAISFYYCVNFEDTRGRSPIPIQSRFALYEREEYREKEKLYAEEINNISKESAKEIEEWVTLTDNFREKLNAAKARIRELEGAGV